MKSKEGLKRGSAGRGAGGGWKSKYLVEKMRQNLRTAFELHTRSVPFRCAANKARPD